jgi:hypothetical protein
MDLEPVLLEAALAAVFDGVTLALGASVECNELPLYIPVLVSSTLLLLNDLFQGAHLVLTLTYIYRFVRIALARVVIAINVPTRRLEATVLKGAEARVVCPSALLC